MRSGRLRILFWAPVLSILMAGIFSLVGRPTAREQVRRIRASHPAGPSRLGMLSTVLVRVKENYINPASMNPQEMFAAALRQLEKSTPEFITETVSGVVRVRCLDQEEFFTLESIRSPMELYRAVQKVFNMLSRVPGSPSQDREVEVINGMLATLDSHTALLPPEIYRELKTGTQGSFSGVGIVVTTREGYLTVIAPMDGTPAARAGIRPGDRIVRIGDISVTHASLNDAVNHLRGKPGTTVSIWVERDSEAQWLHFQLERSIIRLNSVTSRMLPGQIGYVRIRQFSQGTSGELAEHLESLRANHAKGLILDLFNNPGGLLNQAEKSAHFFLSDGIIYSAVGQNRRVSEVRRSTSHFAARREPMVVLINQGSASAAEILAGAIKVHKRALLLGETSFGKGSIQMVNEFEDDSALKLTIAHYLAGGTLAIQSLGVNPHVHVQMIDTARLSQTGFRYRQPPVRDGEPIVGQRDTLPIANLRIVSGKKDPGQEDIDNQAPDELVEAARRLLVQSGRDSAWDVSSIASWSRHETSLAMQELVSHLGKIGVDWTDGQMENGLSGLEAKIKLNGKHMVAGETLTGTLTLLNVGTAPVFRVGAEIRNHEGGSVREVLFGRLDPGEQRSAEFSFPVDAGHVHGLWPLTVEFFSESAEKESLHLPANMLEWIEIRPALRPEFQVHYHFMDDLSGNGDGLLQAGEKGRLRVYLNNVGETPSDTIIMTLGGGTKSGLDLHDNRRQFPRLAPGETRSHDFQISARPGTRPTSTELFLEVEEIRFSRQFIAQIPLPVSGHLPGPLDVNGILSFSGAALLHQGAHFDSPVIGQAGTRSTFPVVGTMGQWAKVQLGPDRTAFALRGSGNLVSPESVPILSPRWTPVWQIQLPRIQILQELPLRSTERTVPFRARFSHPLQIHDVTVEVFGPRAKYLKVLVHRGENRRELELSHGIPLFEGRNRIVVSLRSSWELKTRWEQQIHYTP